MRVNFYLPDCAFCSGSFLAHFPERKEFVFTLSVCMYALCVFVSSSYVVVSRRGLDAISPRLISINLDMDIIFKAPKKTINHGLLIMYRNVYSTLFKNMKAALMAIFSAILMETFRTLVHF